MRAPFSRTLFDLVEEQAVRYPGATAAIFEGRTITYAGLVERARRLASAFQARGIGRGDRVALFMHNCIEWLEAAFGAQALGAIVVPLSTWSKPSEMNFLLRDAEAAFLVAADRFGEQDFAAAIAELIPELSHTPAEDELRSARYPKLRGVVLVGDRMLPGANSYVQFSAAAPLAELPPPGHGARPGDDAFIIYTSGSSGFPKGIRLRHDGTIENGFNIGERQGYSERDRVLIVPSLFWTYASTNALPATFTHGATAVLQHKFDAGDAIALIRKHKCTAIYTLPGITSAIARHPDYSREALSSLRTGMTIGTAQDILQAAEVLGATEICNIYGSSETYGNCCVTSCKWPLEERLESQGEPLPGVEIRIVDPETGAEQPRGMPGLVEVRGYLTSGYTGASAALNAKAFTEDGFFRMGDVGKLTPEGRFVFVARATEMIKRAGLNVSPVEVEDVLLLHDGVGQVGVTGAADPEKDEIIVAFVVPKPGARLTPEELIAHCKARSSRYKIPDRIYIRTDLPVTSTGKLLRRELRSQAETLISGRP